MNTYKVKVISLLRRQDRREKFSETFKGINFEFFDALDGKDYKLTDFDKEFIKGNNYQKFGIHIPSLVCANYSHLSIIKECSQDTVPYFIFEDDVEIIKPIDFKFEEIAKKDLDAFWLIPNHHSIIAYVVWPAGAKKLLDYIYNEVKLKVGLDWNFHYIKGTEKIKDEQISTSYFTQKAGFESDITTLVNYKVDKKII